MNIRKYIPTFFKYPLIIIYIFFRCITRGFPGKKAVLNLAGVLPSEHSVKVIHGGKVKLLFIRERFGDTWKKFNLAYFVSSGLPFAPKLWAHIYKMFGIKIVWNQNGVAYPAWAGDKTQHINSLLNPMHEADYVIYQTEFTKRCADKFLGKYTGPTSVLINPIDTKKFSPVPFLLPAEPLTIIMSGHHFESKERLKISLEAVRELKRRSIEVKLMVIGNVQELPNEDWVEEKGRFTQEEAPRLYNRAHILLHLKNLDPCPTFVLEALASGLPVVGLLNGGMPELVNQASGILIPTPENFEKFQYPTPDEVAEAIIKIKENLQDFSANARKQSLKFDKEIWLKKHEEIFNELIK